MRKKLNKKGIEFSYNLLYALLIAGALVFGGYKTVVFVREKMCQASTADFLSDVAYKFSELAGPDHADSVKTYDIIVPSCIDKVYILDDTKDLTKSKESLPIEINDQYDSGTKNNLIIYKDNKLKKTINTRQITNSKLSFANLEYPYYLCFDATKRKKIQIQEVGFGDKGVKIYPHCDAIECTVVPEIVEGEDLEELIDTACGTTDRSDDCHTAKRQNIQNAKGNIELSLKVSTCFPETTKVEFIIKPREGIAGKEVKIIETIPKECVDDDLKKYLEEVSGGDAEIIIRANPMLVWTFNILSEEERVSYKLNKFLDDNCRKQLKAVVAAEVIVKESAKDKPVIANSDLAAPLVLPDGSRVNDVTKRKPHKERFDPASQESRAAFPIRVKEDEKGKSIDLTTGTPEVLGEDEVHPIREARGEGVPTSTGGNEAPRWRAITELTVEARKSGTKSLSNHSIVIRII